MAGPTLDEVRTFLDEIGRWVSPHAKMSRARIDRLREAATLEDVSREIDPVIARTVLPRELVERTSLLDRIRLAVVPPNTNVLRFDDGEMHHLETRIRSASRPLRILSAPCSTGEEAFTLALFCHRAGAKFAIDAFDVQRELIALARTGTMQFGFPPIMLASPAKLAPEVLARIQFEVADLLADEATAGALPAGTWDIICCRYFLPYLEVKTAVRVAVAMARRVAPGGLLVFDAWTRDAMKSILVEALAEEGLDPVNRGAISFARAADQT